MISAGSYILSAAALAAVALSIGFSAVCLRQRLLSTWEGAPARLVEAIVGIALLIWLSELLGVLNLFYAWTLVLTSLALAGVLAWRLRGKSASPAGGRGGGGSRTDRGPPAGPPSPPDRTRGAAAMSLIALGVVALVFAHWGLTTKDALGRGIFNFDSLWYHMPFAVDMVQSHSVTGLHYTETVFTNWFYPQNSELLHAAGIALTQRDTLSLFINFGFLGLAFLAAWCIGRPYGRGHLSVVAAAVVLECHTLVVREPGAAKNDLMAAALLLAAIAILVNAWVADRRFGARNSAAGDEKQQVRGELPVGWPLAVAGLAVGLAAGTKFTVMAMAAALSLTVIVLAPVGKRWAAAACWFLPALAGGGFWYLRNLVVVGNPLPQVEKLGPIALPHPERLQTARPDFSVAHYATDTAVWRDYFGPGLDHAFGALWPLVIGGAILGAMLAIFRSSSRTPGETQKAANRWSLRCTGDRVVRWMGGVALFGMVAYLFTPLSAAGAEGAPVAFAINLRFAIPAMLIGLTLLPLASIFDDRDPATATKSAFAPLPWGQSGQRLLLGLLLVVLVFTDRPDAVLRDPDRVFAVLLAVFLVLIPAGLIYARRRGASLAAVSAGFAALALAILAIGYPVQRNYLRDRFANQDPETSIPGMHLDSAYRWARGLSGARIGLVGTSAGFLEYGFYGTDLSNEVRYLGAKGPHGAFNAIPHCHSFRAAVNAADLDYLVTAPFLNFIHADEPIPSPESVWLRGEPAVTPIDRSGPVIVWRLRGRLDPSACGPANAPLRHVPNAPSS
ncbi:MAG TPA: hypothetical protein VF176_05820 [Solirubrobacterales bacterium]